MIDRADEILRRLLGLGGRDQPFPWQQRMLERLKENDVPRALDLPTGLGKTSVMPLWLLARLEQPTLPRRLFYVVDRRAVVDQASAVAERLREVVEEIPELKHGLGLEKRPLPVSTLRGQHIDNREWLEDPSVPAIIVGTVDMIGSRLLFQGYRTSRKMRPYAAGLIGCDSLIVLDESHLVPPFERLLAAIVDRPGEFGPGNRELRGIVPEMRTMSLSATGRTGESGMANVFSLDDQDFCNEVVVRRIDASKCVEFVEPEEEERLAAALARHAWAVMDGGSPGKCLVFCNSRKVAVAAKKELLKLKRQSSPEDIDVPDPLLFVGARRVVERRAMEKHLRDFGFIPGVEESGNDRRSRFVFATSAGEVGVDMDADDMVCDLVEWPRMVQRFGRVNRRGGRGKRARIVVVVEAESDSDKPDKLGRPSSMAMRLPFDKLPLKDGCRSVSPRALVELKQAAREDRSLRDVLEAAESGNTLYPELTRALVDDWSMTSLPDHAGRPNVAPWLRGWGDDEPQTAVLWRTYLPRREDGRPLVADLQNKRHWSFDDLQSKPHLSEVGRYFEATPPHLSEILETETRTVVDWLLARVKKVWQKPDAQAVDVGEERYPSLFKSKTRMRPEQVVAISLDRSGETRCLWRLMDFEWLWSDTPKERNWPRRELEKALTGAFLVLDARFLGLNSDGLLDPSCSDLPNTIDGNRDWFEERLGGVDRNDSSQSEAPALDPIVRFRVSVASDDRADDAEWRPRFKLVVSRSAEGDPLKFLKVDKFLHDASTEEDRSVGHAQTLAQHHEWTREALQDMLPALDLAAPYGDALTLAASIHDEGKRAERWQRAFNAKTVGGPWAKTRGPVNQQRLGGYRHELGSLLLMNQNEKLRDIASEIRALIQHIVTAHHGFARPLISIDGYDDASPSALIDTRRQAAIRFASLQRKWGPWGLAWIETCLRAADSIASRRNERNPEPESSL